MNPKVIGNIGLGQAIAYFTSLGWSVSVPLTESQRYDMIVDSGERLYRVEVKTTGRKRASYEASLSTHGGNQSWSGVRKAISKDDCDFVFIHTLDGTNYVFPIEVLDGKCSVNLSSDKEIYKVSFGVARS